tara:strand:+ start:770 stop:1126 length:357 start_codon:yes stop_codon:yes gene_type:complete
MTVKEKNIVKKTTDLSDYLETMILMLEPNLRGQYVREFKFHPKRKWRFDFAFPEAMVAVEADGGEYCQNGGRHSSSSDYEKINQATILGWRVLRYRGSTIKNNPYEVVQQIKYMVANS